MERKHLVFMGPICNSVFATHNRLPTVELMKILSIDAGYVIHIFDRHANFIQAIYEGKSILSKEMDAEDSRVWASFTLRYVTRVEVTVLNIMKTTTVKMVAYIRVSNIVIPLFRFSFEKLIILIIKKIGNKARNIFGRSSPVF